MKKLLILVASVMISTASFAALTDLYNAIDTNKPTETKVDAKAAEVKGKIDSKLNAIAAKKETKEMSLVEKQNAFKAQMEEKLAELVKKGEGESDAAKRLQAEIKAFQKLMDATRK